MRWVWVIVCSLLVEIRAENRFVGEGGDILSWSCFDCHGEGARKGDVKLDAANSLEDKAMWWKAWKNVKAGLMPPPDEEVLTEEDKAALLGWIEDKVFRLDRENPDPGKVVMRRMNRWEYQNTIRDLLSVDYKVEEYFPADDTGYGFDTIGEVLSISPLLLEKYIEAAEEIVERALPQDPKRMPEITVGAGELREAGSNETGRFMEFDKAHTVETRKRLKHGGTFRVFLQFRVEGSMEATDNSAEVVLRVGEKELGRKLLAWDYREGMTIGGEIELKPSEHKFSVEIVPKDPPAEGDNPLGLVVNRLVIRGPVEEGEWMYPESYRQIMFEGPAEEGAEERRIYARNILERFLSQAYRRPVEDELVERLVKLVEEVAAEEGLSFEDGIRQALTAVLASPRFLFRAEIEGKQEGEMVILDEYSLASRLSYFLWGSLPDEQLLELAGKKELRKNLAEEVGRMLEDRKADRFVESFVGQWLQARDVTGIAIDARRILGKGNRHLASLFNNGLRADMKRETEHMFAHVLREGLPATELLDGRYTFLNQRLAEFYEVDGVEGSRFRKVDFAESDVRGGILTQGTFLVVTSNPTRTSPVKRGQFVLENLLGTPAPPAPPDVPELEESAGRKHGKTMREMMVVHRERPLCFSCHVRMDPIGLGFENFNALGLFREEERGQVIDASGKLVTGEQFQGVAELKAVLATSRREDFLRSLAEKLFTYATGRGVEYYDAPALERIVESSEKEGGSLRGLVLGVVESEAFQKRRAKLN